MFPHDGRIIVSCIVVDGNSDQRRVWTLQPTAASQKYAPPAGFSAWDGAGGHSAQAVAYLARTVGGNEGGNATNIANLIDGLVADGVWAKLDALYVLAQQNQTDAQLNLVGTSYGLTSVGLLRSVAFTSYQGFGGWGAAVYLATGFNPAVAPSPQFVQNSASLGVWVYAIVTPSDASIGNSANGAVGETNIYDNFNGSFYARVNANVATGAVPTTVAGLYVGDRSSSASVVPYINGVAQTTQTGASAVPESLPVTIGHVSGAGGASAEALSAAFIGASLGSAGQLALYNRLRTYMTAVGVP